MLKAKTIKSKPKSNDIDHHLGRALKNYRRLAGLSQETLAESSGITFQQIQKYENGKNRISASRMYEFARIFNIKISDFYQGLEISDNDPANANFVFANLDKESIEMIKIFQTIENPEIKKALLKYLKHYVENLTQESL